MKNMRYNLERDTCGCKAYLRTEASVRIAGKLTLARTFWASFFCCGVLAADMSSFADAARSSLVCRADISQFSKTTISKLAQLYLHWWHESISAFENLWISTISVTYTYRHENRRYPPFSSFQGPASSVCRFL